MSKAIGYFLLPEAWDRRILDGPEYAGLMSVLRNRGGVFCAPFRMPGTRPLSEFQVVNVMMHPPQSSKNKNAAYLDLRNDFARVGWDLTKLVPNENINAVHAQLRAAADNELFWFMWHLPFDVGVYREDGTPVLQGEQQKKVRPVYDITPRWFIEFIADNDDGSRPTQIPFLNRWVRHKDFADMPDVVDDEVPNDTPDE